MMPHELKDRNVTVIGGARSGLAVARLLARSGARVFLTERGALGEELQRALRAIGVEFEFRGHTGRALKADLFVVSPGVPSTANIVQHAVRRGMPVYAELEVASWFCEGPILAVTGSNGKTTTTSMLAHMYRTARVPHLVAGNIGYPLSDYVDAATPEKTVILEVSSFQLDHIDRFRPKVSLLLNITPDHLDRYNYNFNEYAQSKFRIFKNQGEGDVLVYGYDDPFVRDYVGWYIEKQKIRAIGFSTHTELEEGAFVRDHRLILRLNQQEEVLMHAENLSLRGTHNLANALAAAVASRVQGIRSDVIKESLMRFEGVPHRMEFVREVDGVRYVNDSKATNVNAVWYALESFNQPVVLIAGGRDKGNDYNDLRKLLHGKARAVIGIGESADKVMHDLGPAVPESRKAQTMEEAITLARRLAQPGDVVLLSPACASFDMFRNYEDRGDTFKRLVHNL